MEIIKINNPFQRQDRDVELIDFEGQTIKDLVLLHIQSLNRQYGIKLGLDFAKDSIQVSINGCIVPYSLWGSTKPQQNNQIIFMPVVGKGQTEKAILSTVAIIAAFVVLGPGAFGIAGLGLEGASLAVAMAAVSMGIGFVSANNMPGVNASPDRGASQAFAWSPATLQEQGIPRPKFYGKNKLYGNVITVHTKSLVDEGNELIGPYRQIMSMLVALGSGPVQGIIDGTIKINDQPIDNFEDVSYEEKTGIMDQTVVSFFDSTKIEYNPNILITQSGGAKVYTTPDADFDDLEIELIFPLGLFALNSDKTKKRKVVELKIEVSLADADDWTIIAGGSPKYDLFKVFVENGSPNIVGQDTLWTGSVDVGDFIRFEGNNNWYEIDTITDNKHIILTSNYNEDTAGPIKYYIVETGIVIGEVRGKIAGPIRFNYVVSESLPAGSSFTIDNGNQYDIRITRIEADTPPYKNFKTLFYLGAIREVIEDSFTYPLTPLVGLSALASERISGRLKFSCIQEGSIVNVYANGEWSLEYSNNPAWVIWDILTLPIISGDGSSGSPYTIERYDGIDFGAYPTRLDLVKFAELAEFCDDLVPNKEGSSILEKRITFNGGFDVETTVWEAALSVAEIARTTLLWNGSELSLWIDKPTEPTQLFTITNILRDSFKETFTPQNELASEIQIHYRDEDQDYKRVPFTIMIEDLPNTPNQITIPLFGITKQTEAWRAGMYRLSQNKLLKSKVALQVDIDAIACNVGDVALIQHDVPLWGTGGRTVSGTTLSFVSDKDLEYEEGITYELQVRLSDDALNERLVTSRYNPIIGVDIGSKEFYISGDYSNEYLDEDRIRVVDSEASIGNDGIYTLDGGASFSGGITTITVNEDITDDSVNDSGVPTDGGLYNLRRIVVSSVFLNTSDDPEAVVFNNIFAFGQQNLNARKYRIIGIKKDSDQYATLTTVEYNPLLYDPDDDTPIIVLEQSIQSPDSDTSIINRPATREEIITYTPTNVSTDVVTDIPLTSNLKWNDNTPGAGSISWSAVDGSFPIQLTYQGESYDITAGNTNKKWIYWDVLSPTIFTGTDTQSESVGAGIWAMSINQNGTAFPAFGVKILHGDIIQAGSIFLSALGGDLDDIDDGSTYSRVLTTSISAGLILMSEVSGTFNDISGDLDDISNGTTYSKVRTTAISAGNIKLSETIGDIDNIGDGSVYSRVLTADIDSGHIKLSETVGDLDDVGDGTNFQKVATASLTAGGLVLWSAINDDDGHLPDDDADVTVNAIESTVVITSGGITMSAGGSVKGGKTSYPDAATAGYFLGYSGSAYVFRVGSASAFMDFNGTILDLTTVDLLVGVVRTDAITTTKILNEATTAISTDVDDTGGTLSAVLTEVVSVEVTVATDQKVVLFASFQIGNEDANRVTVEFLLLRDATPLFDYFDSVNNAADHFSTSCVAFVDTPSAGTYDYSLRLGDNFDDGNILWDTAVLVAMLVKK